MQWLRAHPYTSALFAAGVLIILGAYIITSRISRPTETLPTAWGGGITALVNPTSHQSLGSPQTDETMMQTIYNNPPYTYTAPDFSDAASAQGGDSYDFDAFIALLSQGSASGGEPTNDDSSINAYAYIPRGLISTTSKVVARTELQQALYNYGNEIGSSIESFEQQHADTVQILKNQVEDRDNPEKGAAVKGVGYAFQDLGTNLLTMDSVPSTIASAHTALAKSYIEIGKKLALVPDAVSDSDFIAAIQSYNASADTFTKNYIQVVLLFQVHEVTFSSTDSGRVFTFSASGS